MMAMEFHQRDGFRFRRYVALYVESSLQRRRNQKFRGPTSRRPSWALTSLALIQVDCRLAQIIKLQAELRILEILFATKKLGPFLHWPRQLRTLGGSLSGKGF